MISVELEGYDGLSRKLRWIEKNWEKVKIFALVRMTEVLIEELPVTQEQVIYVRVEDSNKNEWYGFSIEPEASYIQPLEFDDKLFFLSPRDLSDDDLIKASEGNPFTYDNLPFKVSEEEAIYFLRDSSEDEINSVTLENLVFNDLNGFESVDPEIEQPIKEDLRFNTIRGEYGIGEDYGRPVWRNSISNLIQDRIEEIIDDVSTALIEGSVNENDIPVFEKRKESWLRDNEDFMVSVARSSD